MVSGLLVLTLNLTCKGFVMDVVGIEITREGEGWCATVPHGYCSLLVAAARVVGR